MRQKFTVWAKWNNRNNLDQITYPGVYAIALLETKDISGQKFEFREEIIYIGMTNSRGGLQSRLRQFDNTITHPNRQEHSAAQRVINTHQENKDLKNQLYVSISPFKCDVIANQPDDIRTMGDVNQWERYCLAEYYTNWGRLPEFNLRA